MYSQTTRASGLSVVLSAHQGPEGRLLMAEVAADETDTPVGPPVEIAVVVDRSGSMQGRKLEIAKSAVASLVRSLRPQDRIALVVYDDEVDALSGLAAPSEALARTAERIEAGDSTDLYGGWVAGARLVGPGGRIILLSDGLANAGRFTEARDLALHAGLTYEKYRKTTTTIGIGEDYDEALMHGMARAGRGAHYFAHTAEAIAEALGQERFSLGSVALSHVSLRYAGVTRQLGHFWGGETKNAVLRVEGLGGEPATLRLTLAATGATTTLRLEMPREFGHSEAATLELILEDAAQAEVDSTGVRDPRSAGETREAVRKVLLRLLAHPLADSPIAVAVRASLEANLDRLERLERQYDEREATMHRKRSYQASHNVTERAKAYSSFHEDRAAIGGMVAAASAAPPSAATLLADPALLALLPRERWLAWPALPTRKKGSVLDVALPNARDGFVVAAIEKETGLKVRPSQADEADIRSALLAAK